MSTQQELQQTISDMVDDHRGILALDESTPTIKKRFDAIGVESVEENRRFYRSLLLDTQGLGNYISGVILFEETLNQKSDNGKLLPEVAWSQKIVPGIKVDTSPEGQALHFTLYRFYRSTHRCITDTKPVANFD